MHLSTCDESPNLRWPDCAYPGDHECVGRAFGRYPGPEVSARVDEFAGRAESGACLAPQKSEDGCTLPITNAVVRDGQTDDALLTRVADMSRAMSGTSVGDPHNVTPSHLDEPTVSLLKHELRTPLTSVIAFTSMLLLNPSGNLNDKQIVQLKAIQRGGTLIRDLIDRVFDVAQLVAGEIALAPVPTEMNSLVTGLLESMSLLFAAKGQSIKVDTGFRSHWALADGYRVSEAVTDVLSNATKYAPPGSRIKITLNTSDGMTKIAIEDQGPGICQEDRSRIFDLFYRGSSAIESTDGTGLGLFIARRLVELQGGTITVRSEVGAGTTVQISLPAVPDPLTAPAQAA